MRGCCNLEVDVNGQETFLVHKKILSSYSGRLSKLFSTRSISSKIGKLKVVFHDFPGGVEGFELMAKFCYNNGKIEITPQNIVLLNRVAHFMKMDSLDGSMKSNLINQTEKSLGGIDFWSWSDILTALKQCQDLVHATDSSFVVQEILVCLVQRLALPTMASSCTSSSDSSCHRLSCDTVSLDNKRTKFSHKTWWFEDLLVFSIEWIDRIIRTMMFEKFDYAIIAKFLVYYLKSKFPNASSINKSKYLEGVIHLLSLLDKNSLSCKCLFEILRLASGLRISKRYCTLLERLIGSQLDQATLNQLLIPSPQGDSYAYDVNLVIRIVKAFLQQERNLSSPHRLEKIGSLMDSYIEEVAVDTNLKPAEFRALIKILPDAARKSQDKLYKSIDMYFQIHLILTGNEKSRMCGALNCNKLSPETLKQLIKNSRFPSKIRTKALATIQRFKLLDLLLHRHGHRNLSDSSFCENHIIKKTQALMADFVKPRLSCQGKVVLRSKLCPM